MKLFSVWPKFKIQKSTQHCAICLELPRFMVDAKQSEHEIFADLVCSAKFVSKEFRRVAEINNGKKNKSPS